LCEDYLEGSSNFAISTCCIVLLLLKHIHWCRIRVEKDFSDACSLKGFQDTITRDLERKRKED
jgi:hypothetical protein